MGTYLATVHQQGVAVWGGASTFIQLMRYAHKEVFIYLFIYYICYFELTFSLLEYRFLNTLYLNIDF